MCLLPDHLSGFSYYNSIFLKNQYAASCGFLFFWVFYKKVFYAEAFFKVVLCLNGTPKGIGFIRRNTDTSKRNDLYVNSISEVERITRITFFPTLSKEVAETVKSQANLKDWDQNLFKR